MADAPTALVVVSPEEKLELALRDQDKIETLRTTIAADLKPPEFDLFIEICRSKGLNPFDRQIHAIVRGTGERRKVTFQTGIDGYRLIAQRTQRYDGQDEPLWCGEDGVWRDVWLDSEHPPAAAKVTVYRKDMSRPFTGIAKYSEYVQMSRDYDTKQSRPNEMWSKMPANQLAKCAEALALRKAFAAEMSGVYTAEEMAQADNDREVKDVTPPARQAARETVAKGAAKAEADARKREQPTGEDAAKRQKQLDALPDWAKDAYLTLETMGHKFSALSAVLGKPVTVKAIDEWAAALPEGVDPYAEITKRFAATLPDAAEPEPEVVDGEVVSETVETEEGDIVDAETGEIVGQVPSDEGDPFADWREEQFA